MKKIATKLLIIFLTLLSACGILKNIRKKSSESKLNVESSLKNDSSFNHVLVQGKAILLKDSINDEFYTEIIPVGTFSYHPQQGFRGQASSIRTIEKSRLMQQTEGRVTSFARTEKSRRVDNQTKTTSFELSKTEDKQVRRQGNAWIWFIIAAFITVFFLYNMKSKNS